MNVPCYYFDHINASNQKEFDSLAYRACRSAILDAATALDFLGHEPEKRKEIARWILGRAHAQLVSSGCKHRLCVCDNAEFLCMAANILEIEEAAKYIKTGTLCLKFGDGMAAPLKEHHCTPSSYDKDFIKRLFREERVELRRKEIFGEEKKS